MSKYPLVANFSSLKPDKISPNLLSKLSKQNKNQDSRCPSRSQRKGTGLHVFCQVTFRIILYLKNQVSSGLIISNKIEFF